MSEELSFENEINEQLKRDPFKPFALTAASGERYEISEHVQVAIGKSTITLFYARSGFTLLRKNQLVALHTI
jgi:predicted NodU family carbamoyl transferase